MKTSSERASCASTNLNYSYPGTRRACPAVSQVHIYLDTMTANIEVFFESPASQWIQGEDGKWYNPEMDEDEYYYLPDNVWKNLRLIQTNDLSVNDIRAFLENDAKKISEDGWALADDGRTVVEII